MSPLLTELPAWTALTEHHRKVQDTLLADLFAGDDQRGERLSAEGAGLYLDYSKNRVTDETLALLMTLAREAGVERKRDAMFAGERINVTENRAVLHANGTVMYLRASPDQLYRRLKSDTKRPLLQVADPLQALKDLYAARDPLYRETAHFVMETGRPSLAMLVNKILMQIDMMA